MEHILHKTLSTLFTAAFFKRAEKASLPQLQSLAAQFTLPQTQPDGKRWAKKDLVEQVHDKIREQPVDALICAFKESRVGLELEVKDILTHEIPVGELMETQICLPLAAFFEKNPFLQEKFSNTCDLVLKNDSVTSLNCVPCETQGLYILTIGKDGIDYIVKIGSYAETQGMSKRIGSFGGGNYETGSATNKWFQRFIKRALAEGFTSKFTYYNNTLQQAIEVQDLAGSVVQMMPFVMRPLESQLFQIYNKSNCNIPPLFGSNCT